MSDTFITVPSLYIAPDVMQEAAESQSFLLTPPENARVAGKNKFWTELFDVFTSEMFVPEERPDRVCIKLTYRIAPESDDSKNVGKKLSAWYYLNYGSLTQPAAGNKERTMTMISLGKLGALLTAIGIDVSGGFDPKTYFAADPVEGTDPAVQGTKFYGLVKQYADKNGDKRDEITKFDSLDAGSEAEI